MPDRRKFTACIAPLAAFLAGLGLVDFLHKLGGAFWLAHGEFWVYPLQTVLCGLLLTYYWREYPIRSPRRIWIGLLVGLFVFVIWIAPQAFLGFAARRDGFNPDVLASQPLLHGTTVFFRFLRLVVVVPLIEEIFWRGFLLRVVIKEDFDSVPFGTFSWLSFILVAAAFAFSHARPDWAAAFITGALYNGVAYWTRSLTSCVVTHALTNLLLGLWIMQTGQWGFW